MKIILSGGWGYENLGDDAILLASIDIIRKKSPTSKIIVLSYNDDETRSILQGYENIQVIPSAHKLIFGWKPHDSYQAPSAKNDLKKLFRKLFCNRLSTKYNENILSNNNIEDIVKSEKLNVLKNLFDSKSTYIMSGGGYINDWAESIISKGVEVQLACLHKAKCVAIGQTIGPFQIPAARNLAKEIFSKMSFTTFRDSESIKDSLKMGVKCNENFMPDLALSKSYSTEKKQYIAVIPFKHDIYANMHNFCENLKRIAEYKSCEIVVTVSQLWYNSIKLALDLYWALKEKKCNVKLIIPNDVFELQKILGEAQLTLAQNLHALILSYRANTPIICLNNKRKFLSFMEIVGMQNSIFDISRIKGMELFDYVVENNVFPNMSFENQVYEGVKELFC